MGLIPDSGGTWVLPRLVGQARALGLALTGEPLSAEKSADWGLIWKAVDDDALDAEVDAIAEQARLASAARPRRDQGHDPLQLAARLDQELDRQARSDAPPWLHRGLSRGRRCFPREADADIHRQVIGA